MEEILGGLISLCVQVDMLQGPFFQQGSNLSCFLCNGVLSRKAARVFSVLFSYIFISWYKSDTIFRIKCDTI